MRHDTVQRGLAAALLGAVLLPCAAAAQASSDIFVADLSRAAGGWRVGTPVNLTLRPGYDNQPHFTADGGAILYTSIRDGQADVFRVDLGTRAHERLTATPESEYSPTPVSGGFSVVRVEADSTQRLWRFGPDGTAPELLLPDVAPVGYHAWGEGDRVALFVLGSPARLKWADAGTGELEPVAEDIGRTIQRVPGRDAVSFIQRLTAERTFVVEVDMRTRRLKKLAEMHGGGDYHAWLPDGTLLMSSGSRILHHDLRAGSGWREVADLGRNGLRVTRLAVSPSGDRLAFVGEPLP
jgi:hypothetical protein